jgi:hypothetical protein
MTTKWNILRQQFVIEHSSTGVTLKAWCKSRNMSYHTARKHIKVRAQIAQPSVRKKCSKQSIKEVLKPPISKSNKHINHYVTWLYGQAKETEESIGNALSKKRVAVLDYQNVLAFDYNYDFINGYEAALQYSSALHEALREGNKNLTMMQMQRSDRDVEIKHVLDEMSGELTMDMHLQLYEKLGDLFVIDHEMSARIFPLSNLLNIQRLRIAQIARIIALMRDGKM